MAGRIRHGLEEVDFPTCPPTEDVYQEIACMENPKNHLKPNIFERNPKKTLFILFTVFLVCAAVVADKILQSKSRPRFLGPVRYVNLKEYPPGLVNWVKPTKELLQLADNLEDREYLFRVDDNGFIMPSKIHKQPDRSIAFLGGSSTECFFADEEKRWPYLVGRLLENDTGLKVNAYNAGMSGINSFNSINILINKVVPLKPQVVFMLHNINDLGTLLYDKTYWNKNSKTGPLVQIDTSLRANLKATYGKFWVSTFPYLYPAIKAFTTFPKKPEQHNAFSGETTHKVEVDKAHLLSEFGANLELFIHVCRVRNITPVLITQANRLTQAPEPILQEAFLEIERLHGISYKIFKDMHTAFNNRIREVATANNVMLIDLDAMIPQHKDYLYDACHFTASGCEKVAELINEKVKPLLTY